MNRLRTVLYTAMLVLTQVSFAQLFTSKNETIVSPLNKESLLQKDSFNEKLGQAPRFAIDHDVEIDLLKNGSTKNKTYFRSHRVRSSGGTVSFNFAFKNVHLSKNSTLVVRSTDKRFKTRAFTQRDNSSAGELWTPVVLSADVMIELRVPTSELSQTSIELFKINQGYRRFSEPSEKSGDCNIDVVCPEGNEWAKEINSVAVISVGGRTFCTGFMINNAEYDRRPFFMTAKHCGIDEQSAPSLVTYWNYQASECGGDRDGELVAFNTGATHLADSSLSDFTLVELNEGPRPEWDVHYAGWDRRANNASSAIAIHHPSTDEKSISFEWDPTSLTSYLSATPDENATHVRVEDWDLGTTEPGSSGSPLFNQDKRVIGQLHGGYASCRSQTADWYGRFYRSWEGEGEKGRRLKDYLDPNGLGIFVVDTI